MNHRGPCSGDDRLTLFPGPDHFAQDDDIGTADATEVLVVFCFKEISQAREVVKRNREISVMGLVISESVRGEEKAFEGVGVHVNRSLRSVLKRFPGLVGKNVLV